VFPDQVDALMSNPKLPHEVDAKLVGDDHPRSQKIFGVPLVQIGGFMSYTRHQHPKQAQWESSQSKPYP